MRLGKLYLFRVLGIPIQLDYTWFLILVFFTWVLASGYYPPRFPDWSRATYWVIGLLSVLLLFASVLLHELGHSWVALRTGIPISSITLFLFGGVAQMSRQPPDAETEFKMAIAGPLTSLGLAVVFLALAQLLPSAPKALFTLIGGLNAALALFNLVPGFPLDGGRVLRAFLWKRRGDLVWATRISSRAGKVVAVTIMVLGFLRILLGNLSGFWFILIGLFLLQAAEAGYRQVLFRTALSGTTVRQIMRPEVVVVSQELPIDQLVNDYFLRHHYTSYPVVDQEKLTGLITLANVKNVPRSDWTNTTVKHAMTPLNEIMTLDPSEDAVTALQRMVKDGIGRFPVVKERKLVGILTRRDIVELLKIKTDLGR